VSNELWIELQDNIIVTRIKGMPTDALIRECHEKILLLLGDAPEGRILYDVLEMEAPPVDVPLSQWELDHNLEKVRLRRAILVPNSKLAYMARLAFGESEHRVFYNDKQAALTWLIAERNEAS